jgi:dTDP-4-amino-4,6-dideoxygalactose transaminase
MPTREAYFEVLQSVKVRPCPRRSIIAPNRLEIRNEEFLTAFLNFSLSRPLLKLREKLQSITGRENIFFAPSCRAALAQLLATLPQKDVVLPAYTCPVVKKAAILAGKNIIYVDVAKNSINSTSEEFAKEIKSGRILIPTHLYGIPTDVEAICNLAKTKSCLTIEDAAAAFGSRRMGKMLGTFGDAGVISFEQSKRLPAFRGAAIIINNEKAFDLEKLRTFTLFDLKFQLPMSETAKAVLYNLATVPWIYGRLTLPLILKKYSKASHPQPQNLFEAARNSPFYLRGFHPFQAALILAMLKRFENIRTRIGQLVSIYRQILKDSNIRTFIPADIDESGLLRFPIAFPGRERLEILSQALLRGLFLEINYDQPLPEKEDWSKFPNARWAAQNVILLPLYARLSPEKAAVLAKEVVQLSH